MNIKQFFTKLVKYVLCILCMAISSNVSAQVTIDSVITHNLSCDDLKGKIIIYASGALDITYSIDGNTFVASNIFTDLDVDDYLIFAKDESNGDVDVSTTQLLNLTNAILPTITCPSNLDVECSQQDLDIVTETWIETCVSQDHTGSDTSNEVLTDLAGYDFSECGGEFVVEFGTNDACGNFNNCFTTINVIDNEAPIATCPGMLEIDIKDTVWPDLIENWLEEIETSDNCSSGLRIQNSYEDRWVLLTCEEEFFIEVEFYVEDICENSSQCNSTIKVNNELAPLVNCDQDMEINCGEEGEEVLDLLLERFEELNAFDEDITVDNFSSIDGIEELKCGETFSIDFTIEDSCERTAECSSIITVNDLLAPDVTTCPESIEIDFSKDNLLSDIADWKSMIIAEDNCGSVSYSSSLDALSFVDYCDVDKLDVEFVATDDCGNSAEPCMAVLTIAHETIELVCPTTLALECGHLDNSLLTTNWLENAKTTSSATYGYELVSEFTIDMLEEGCSVNIPVVFSLTDDCNRNHTCESKIEITDNENPTITCPDELNLESSELRNDVIYQEWLDTASGMDNCGAVNLVHTDLIFEDLGCSSSNELVFTVTDECQNSSTCVTSVILNTKELDCPDIIEVVCDDDMTEMSIQQELAAIRIENSFSGYEIDSTALNLVCDSLSEYEVLFYKDGLCYEGEVCRSILRIIPEDVAVTQVESTEKLYFPNTISPSSLDDRNKSFVVLGKEASSEVEYVQIFNRWGNVIWNTSSMIINDSTSGWKGLNADGKLVESGTYLYVVKINNLEGLSDFHRGTITLLN